MQSTSSRFQINWVDVWKTARTVGVVGVASAVLYFINNVEPSLVGMIPGGYATLLPVITGATELVRRWAMNYGNVDNYGDR